MILFNVTRDGWCDGSVAYLAENWLAMRTADIAHALGCSRNALLGKANRCGLPRKPSVNNPNPGSAPRALHHRPHINKATLPPLAAARLELRVRASHQTTELARRRQVPLIVPVVPSMPPPTPHGECQWPMWRDNERMPRDESKRFCGAPVTYRLNQDGSKHWSSFCEQHHSLAYHKVRDLRDEAA